MKSYWKKLAAVAALTMAPLTASLAVPTISFASPSGLLHPAGTRFGVDVIASGFTDLFAYQFSFGFDPAVLQVLTVTEGPFLATGGATFFDGGTVDNVTGHVGLAFDTLISAIAGVSGNGVLAHLDLAAMAAGASSLTFADVVALDSNLGEIAVTAQATALAVPEPDTIALVLIAAAGGVGWSGRRRLRVRRHAGDHGHVRA